MAEREGFEPSVPLQVHMISNHAHSTTLPPLRVSETRVIRGSKGKIRGRGIGRVKRIPLPLNRRPLGFRRAPGRRRVTIRKILGTRFCTGFAACGAGFSPRFVARKAYMAEESTPQRPLRVAVLRKTVTEEVLLEATRSALSPKAVRD